MSCNNKNSSFFNDNMSLGKHYINVVHIHNINEEFFFMSCDNKKVFFFFNDNMS